MQNKLYNFFSIIFISTAIFFTLSNNLSFGDDADIEYYHQIKDLNVDSNYCSRSFQHHVESIQSLTSYPYIRNAAPVIAQLNDDGEPVLEERFTGILGFVEYLVISLLLLILGLFQIALVILIVLAAAIGLLATAIAELIIGLCLLISPFAFFIFGLYIAIVGPKKEQLQEENTGKLSHFAGLVYIIGAIVIAVIDLSLIYWFSESSRQTICWAPFDLVCTIAELLIFVVWILGTFLARFIAIPHLTLFLVAFFILLIISTVTLDKS